MKSVKYNTTNNKQLANKGWHGVAHHSHLQTIYQQGYPPDHSVCLKSHESTRQKAYDRSKEELGMALNPQEMY